MATSDQPQAKGPVSDVSIHFKALAKVLGNAPTDESALTDLALWLIRWQVRNDEFAHTPHYTLPGQMREVLSNALDVGQFLEACKRLHNFLAERLAIEPTARQLLGAVFSTENWQTVQDALKWWAGWIRAESELARPVRTGADVYLEALERIPIAIREVGNIPQYVVTTSGDFDREMRPLWEGFRVAIRALGFGEQQSLRNQLNGLRDIDREKLKRQREQFEQNKQYAYPLEWLHDEYQPFRFEIAGHPDGFQDGRPVGSTFWADLSLLVLLKQGAVQSALTVLNANLHDAVPPSAPTAALDADATPDRLTVEELALLCVYAGHCITDANAKEYLEGELTSGRALYNKFSHYRTLSNRIGFADETALVRKNMIARIQKVLPRLNDEQKKRAENDIHTLDAQNQ